MSNNGSLSVDMVMMMMNFGTQVIIWLDSGRFKALIQKLVSLRCRTWCLLISLYLINAVYTEVRLVRHQRAVTPFRTCIQSSQIGSEIIGLINLETLYKRNQ